MFVKRNTMNSLLLSNNSGGAAVAARQILVYCGETRRPSDDTGSMARPSRTAHVLSSPSESFVPHDDNSCVLLAGRGDSDPEPRARGPIRRLQAY